MQLPENPPRRRSERTRARILRAAERVFARDGFDGARLEDVAQGAGLRRASIVYYFRDKRELYEAVLAQLFSELRERIDAALGGAGEPAERIEAAVGAWVDFVGERPALARLLLREVAATQPDREPAMLAQVRPFFELVRRFLARAARERPVGAPSVDPVHLAATIAGATLFFIAALPSLVPQMGIDPLSPTQLGRHRRAVLLVTRRLLGIEDGAAVQGGERWTSR